ncbi:hypothetical protein [Serratia marcescens]|uniref:hypothetical protein n=1 Tax=Serratia marcescens TaxID=615 RepID=UPI000F7DCB95|nr:hypothetical protein [Serratia marcescens]RTF49617.1 hypothetical protein D9B78_07485 [Serratia marcescens]
MDKIKEEFEQWWQQEDYDNRLSNIQGVMFNRIKQGMFAAWQASRASIVVDFYEPDSYMTAEATRLAYKSYIRAIGLSIKGE